MDSVRPATWLPTVLGVGSALLAIDALRELVYVPADRAQFILLGWLIEGSAAWLVASLHLAFLAWLTMSCFQRRAAAVWGVFAYGLYWIVTVWVWSTAYAPGGYGTRLITNSFFTVTLLAMARIVLTHRKQFHR